MSKDLLNGKMVYRNALPGLEKLEFESPEYNAVVDEYCKNTCDKKSPITPLWGKMDIDEYTTILHGVGLHWECPDDGGAINPCRMCIFDVNEQPCTMKPENSVDPEEFNIYARFAKTFGIEKDFVAAAYHMILNYQYLGYNDSENAVYIEMNLFNLLGMVSQRTDIFSVADREGLAWEILHANKAGFKEGAVILPKEVLQAIIDYLIGAGE